MNNIKTLLNEALDGVDAPGASYKPGLDKKQLFRKLASDYNAYRDNMIVGGQQPGNYATWLKKKKKWGNKQKTHDEPQEPYIGDYERDLDNEFFKMLPDEPEKIVAKKKIAPPVRKVNESIDVTEINNLLVLSGLPSKLANATSVAGTSVSESEYFTENNGLGLAHQRELDEMIDNIESSINGVSKRFSELKSQMDKMDRHMNDEEKMHYHQGVSSMIDLMSDVANNLRHRLG